MEKDNFLSEYMEIIEISFNPEIKKLRGQQESEPICRINLLQSQSAAGQPNNAGFHTPRPPSLYFGKFDPFSARIEYAQTIGTSSLGYTAKYVPLIEEGKATSIKSLRSDGPKDFQIRIACQGLDAVYLGVSPDDECAEDFKLVYGRSAPGRVEGFEEVRGIVEVEDV